MSLSTQLDDDAKTALKAGEKVRLATIRRARAALKNAEIEARGPVSDDHAVRVLRGLVKRHQESIESFAAGNRSELVKKEQVEMAILEEYLPQQLGDDAIEAVVREVIAAEGIDDVKAVGKVMKPAMAKLAGQADGGRVRDIALRILGG
jgi:uncharacterized protein